MRYIKRIHPTNIKAEFLDNDTIEFDLPNNIIDISSFKLFYQAFVDPVEKYNGDTYLKRFMPRLSQSCIEEINIFKENVLLQQIKDFNLLYNILHDGLKDVDEIDSDKINTLQYSKLDDNNVCQKYNDFYNSSNIKSPQAYEYVVKDFLGFLQDVKYLDCRNMNIKVSFKLAPKYITYRGLNYNSASKAAIQTDCKNTENYHYKLSNVFANIDCITPDENVPIENSKIEFKDYKTIRGKNDNNKNVSLYLKHKGAINWVLSTFVDYNRETDTGLQLYGVNSEIATFGNIIVVEDNSPYNIAVANSLSFTKTVTTAFADTTEVTKTYATPTVFDASHYNNVVSDLSSTIDKFNVIITNAKNEIEEVFTHLKDNNVTASGLYENKINENNLTPEVIKNLNTENLLNNSLWFKRNGLNILDAKYTLNGQDITPNMSMKEIYLNAKEFFQGMDRVKSLVSFQNEFFCFPMMLNIKDKNMISELQWDVTADRNSPNGGKPIMFVCYDKSM